VAYGGIVALLACFGHADHDGPLNNKTH
jgi:hypothetical protein